MLTDDNLADLQTRYAAAIDAGIGSILRDRRDREEAAADAVLAVWRHRDELHLASLGAWIRKAARWAALSMARRQRAREVRIPAWSGDWGWIPLAEPDPGPEARVVLQEALAEVPAPERQAVLLVAVGGYGVRAAGRLAGVSHDTAWRRVRAARWRLAASLADWRWV